MFGKKLGIGTGILAALSVVATAIPAGAAGSAAHPAWQRALNARGDAVNREYGLGRYTRPAASTTTPDWLRALTVRSEALNVRYGLGSDARRPASTSTPGWLKALTARSEALNRLYGLGEYAASKGE